MNYIQYFFVGLIVLCFAAGFGLDFFPISRSSQRRIYWASTCLAALSGFMLAYPNWKTGLWIAGIALATMTFLAYATTPYIKVGGKIYAVSVSLSRPAPEELHTPPQSHASTEAATTEQPANPQFDAAPDSYGGTLTATTMWWMLVVLAVIAAGNVYFFLFSDGQAPVAAVGAGFLALLALTAGYADASWDYPIARGKYIPLGVVSIITAGAFALLYLTAYYTGRRFPLRRSQSMEYRARARHRNQPDNRGSR